MIFYIIKHFPYYLVLLKQFLQSLLVYNMCKLSILLSAAQTINGFLNIPKKDNNFPYYLVLLKLLPYVFSSPENNYFPYYLVLLKPELWGSTIYEVLGLSILLSAAQTWFDYGYCACYHGLSILLSAAQTLISNVASFEIV